jgi:lipoic acid synthetase
VSAAVPLPVIGSGPAPVAEPRPARRPRPDWLKVRVPSGPAWGRLRTLLREKNLHTVCEEARCPNVAECWGQGTATFMILGDICTRACRFCAVTTGRPVGLDLEEPERVADAVELMELRHAVITSVNRDDLGDGGAGIFAETIRAVRRRCPDTTVEVLIPDFQGDWAALAIVMEEEPEILNHNVETVPRLYKAVRPGARYRRSLDLLRRAKELRPGALTKTGVMLGLGETAEELDGLMEDLVHNSVDILTAGQYLQPTPAHLPVERFVPPAEFREVAERGKAMGLRHVEAGPLVRSSYHAANQIPAG